MIEQQTAAFASFVETLSAAGVAPDSEALEKIARALAKLFDADPDEAAILLIDPKSKNLKFVIPEKLAAVGSIPLSSTNALAARTARERRAEVVNNFSSSRHSTVFEGVPLGRRQGETIQKIMSAPILEGTQIRGIVQISRKGHSPSSAGTDFTQKDLRLLVSLSPTLERFLKLFPTG
jgi:GAF domain